MYLSLSFLNIVAPASIYFQERIDSQLSNCIYIISLIETEICGGSYQVVTYVYEV